MALAAMTGRERLGKAREKADAERLLARLRCAKVRIKLLELEIDEVGIWLAQGFITPAGARRWLDDLALDAVGWLPDGPNEDEAIEVLPEPGR
jgi:hypothetical protein